MRQAVSAVTMSGFGASPQAASIARPQFSHGAEFRHGHELIGIRGQPEIDGVARGVERHAARFERAQIGDGACQSEGEFLRVRSAGIMDDAAVGDRERPAKAVARKFADHGGESGRHLIPISRALARGGKAADRIDAETQIERCRAIVHAL